MERYFTLAVEDANDPPVAVDDGVAPVVGAGMISPQPDGSWDPIVVVGGAWHEIDVLANDTDQDGHDLLVKKIETAPNPGDARKSSGGAAVEYKGPADYSGPDQFGYIAKDVPPAGQRLQFGRVRRGHGLRQRGGGQRAGRLQQRRSHRRRRLPGHRARDLRCPNPNPWHGG